MDAPYLSSGFSIALTLRVSLDFLQINMDHTVYIKIFIRLEYEYEKKRTYDIELLLYLLLVFLVLFLISLIYFKF
jgi:hypothetical protein